MQKALIRILLIRRKNYWGYGIVFIMLLMTLYGINFVEYHRNVSKVIKVIDDMPKEHLETLNHDGSISEHDLKTRKTILVWYTPFVDRTMIPEYIHDNDYTITKDGIEIDSPLCGRCSITYNRTLISESDAVLFHLCDLNIKDLPPNNTRKNEQLYVMWTQECPGLVKDRYRLPSMSKEYMNMTMTYQRSSDIFSPYNTFAWVLKMLWSKEQGTDLMLRLAKLKNAVAKPVEQLESNSATKLSNTNIPQNLPLKIQKLLKKKDRSIVWMVSNCGGTTGAKLRYKYFKMMYDDGLNIHVFGGCGNNKGHFPPYPRWDPKFFEALSRYKFYLAFENSYHCEDYISEKLWHNALYSGAVPVIYGPHKEDIEAVLPPGSYIHVEDFSNHTYLVQYLKYLEQNNTAYAEYLKWRTWTEFLDEKGEFNPNNNIKTKKMLKHMSKEQVGVLNKYVKRSPSGFCAFCRELHKTRKSKTKMTASVNDWLKNDRSECLSYKLASEMTKDL